MRWIEDYDQAFEEGEQEYAEEFRKKLSPKNLSDFMNLMSSPYKISLWPCHTGEGYRRVGYRLVVFMWYPDRLVEGADKKLDRNEYGLSEIERIQLLHSAQKDIRN